MQHAGPISRRAFLKLAACSLAGLGFSQAWEWEPDLDAPLLGFEQLPPHLQEIIQRTSHSFIGNDGLLYVTDMAADEVVQAPLARTEWNLRYHRSWHELVKTLPWGIVLHWYGDKEGFDRSIAGYLRGFDSLRDVDGQMIRTSAHFVVGSEDPLDARAQAGEAIGFLQTQLPAPDGTPYMASHLQSLDYAGWKAGEQYFVKALDRLSHANAQNHHLLQDMYQGLQIDPNLRTLAIEVAGHNFDTPEHLPDAQKTANVLSLVMALMRRYHIPASGLLGHHELQLGKSDPGKQYLGLIRYLVGVKTLIDGDPLMWSLVFGLYQGAGENPLWAARRYFSFVRSYLTLTATPLNIYSWESLSGYWLVQDSLPGLKTGIPVVREFDTPVVGETRILGDTYLQPVGHSGLDLYGGETMTSRWQAGQRVRLIADGQCLHVSQRANHYHECEVIFRHRQPDGAEFLSVYGHVEEKQAFKPGTIYARGTPIGRMRAPGDHSHPFLHFGLGYGAAWETALNQRPEVPLNATQTWIRRHFIDPSVYDFQRFQVRQETQADAAWLFD
jgi:hypothetical protein